jgi:hypothetical protein
MGGVRQFDQEGRENGNEDERNDESDPPLAQYSILRFRLPKDYQGDSILPDEDNMTGITA